MNVTFFQAFRSTQTSRNPIYVSIGHKISLETALKICELCCKHRVPEPIRQVQTLKLRVFYLITCLQSIL